MPCVDVYLSANLKGSISIFNTKRTLVALVVAVAATAFVGCGSDDTSTDQPASASTGATQAVTPATTGETGVTAVDEPTDKVENVNPNDPGEGDEEAARSVVDIGLKNGGLTKDTARKIHVPSFIPVELSIKVLDGETYNLVITTPNGKEQLATYNKQGTFKQLLDGMRTNKTTTVVLGGEQGIKITADADPGP